MLSFDIKFVNFRFKSEISKKKKNAVIIKTFLWLGINILRSNFVANILYETSCGQQKLFVRAP